MTKFGSRVDEMIKDRLMTLLPLAGQLFVVTRHAGPFIPMAAQRTHGPRAPPHGHTHNYLVGLSPGSAVDCQAAG